MIHDLEEKFQYGVYYRVTLDDNAVAGAPYSNVKSYNLSHGYGED